MKHIVHVNQHHIKANRKDGGERPVLTCKTYKSNDYANNVAIVHEGEEIGRFIYSPDKPLSCGAHVWFETSRKGVDVIPIVEVT